MTRAHRFMKRPVTIAIAVAIALSSVGATTPAHAQTATSSASGDGVRTYEGRLRARNSYCQRPVFANHWVLEAVPPLIYANQRYRTQKVAVWITTQDERGRWTRGWGGGRDYRYAYVRSDSPASLSPVELTFAYRPQRAVFYVWWLHGGRWHGPQRSEGRVLNGGDGRNSGPCWW